MSVDIEYAIRQDIRNNPVVREVDVAQKREVVRTLCLAALIVAMLLFSAWQHFEIVNNGRLVSKVQDDLAQAQLRNRQLRLELETWRTPARIEDRAVHELHMVAPVQADTLILDHASTSVPPRSVVAQVR